MVAINSIPQQEVAKGKGQSELALARPTTSFSFVAKKPSPTTPSGASTIFVLDSVIFIKDFRYKISEYLKLKLNHFLNQYCIFKKFEIKNRKSKI
jgi:hypothetical protein